MLDLDANKSLIFRVTHIDNVAWDLQHGLQCRNSTEVNQSFRNIGILDLIEARKEVPVPIPPRVKLSDYVPFYFTPRSAMLYNIKTGYNVAAVPTKEIVIYVSSLRRISTSGGKFVFTDRHARLATAQFFRDLNKLDVIDWSILQRSDFKGDPADPSKKERYQAEALIHLGVPCNLLTAVVCYDVAANSYVSRIASDNRLSVKVLTKPELYF